jgi:hypothetical protein
VNEQRRAPRDGDLRGDAGFDDFLCDGFHACFVRVAVSIVDGEVEAIGAIDLDINEPRTGKGSSMNIPIF